MQITHIASQSPPSAQLFSDVTGVILAGGRSRRMGQDKATLVVHGERLFDRAAHLLQTLFPQVLIAGERSDLARPGLSCHADRYPGSALGGLHCGLAAAQTPWICVLPCDLPTPEAALLRLMLACRTDCDAVVPRTASGPEPVVALYHRHCLAPMATLLQRGECRIAALYPRVKVRFLAVSGPSPTWQRALWNLNTPQDLAGFLEVSA